MIDGRGGRIPSVGSSARRPSARAQRKKRRRPASSAVWVVVESDPSASPHPPPVSRQKPLELASIRLEGIQTEGEQALHGVQVGTGRALAGGKREVAGEVGQGQLAGGNQLSWRPLPLGVAGGAGAGGSRATRAGSGLSNAAILAALTNDC